MPDLVTMMTDQERAECGVERLSPAEHEALVRWGLRMFGMSQHVVSEIDSIKYDGHLLVLNDGSRWEVAAVDSDAASIWSELDKLLVIDGEMYNLEDCEKVEVSQED